MNRDFLMALLETASPSGYEKNAALLWKEEARKFADLVHGDIHGNSFAKVATTYCDFPVKIMLAGHIDEIGLLITYIDDQGFVYFETIGGFDNQIFPGQRVRIYARDGKIIKGCIGRIPVHLLDETERKNVVKVENIWIDVGGKEVAQEISTGDYAVLDYSPEFLGNGNILVSRGIDDKIGAFIILEALKKVKKDEIETAICAVATVQEEIGLRGAKTSAYSVEPKIGIAIDVIFAGDHPQAKGKYSRIKLGAGPVITVGPNITPAIHKSLVETAKQAGIPYQIEAQARATGTDANVIQLNRNGVATGLVSIPNRYMHSPCEMICMEDVENCINLLSCFVMKDIRDILRNN